MVFSESSAKFYIEDFENSDYYEPGCHYAKYLSDFEYYLYKISIGEIEEKNTIYIDPDKIYGKKNKGVFDFFKKKKELINDDEKALDI